jgi:hypothetical protein
MDNYYLVLHKVHPKILSSRRIMFVAKFIPNLFMAFGKIIHNADIFTKICSNQTRQNKTIRNGEREITSTTT